MGDRTPLTVKMSARGLSAAVVKDIEEIVGRPDRYVLGDMLQLCDPETSCGSSDDIAVQVDEVLRRHGVQRPYTVYEDPAYQWLGSRVSYAPGLGFHRVECDSDGAKLLSEVEVRGLVGTDDVEARMEATAAAYGDAWREASDAFDVAARLVNLPVYDPDTVEEDPATVRLTLPAHGLRRADVEVLRAVLPCGGVLDDDVFKEAAVSGDVFMANMHPSSSVPCPRVLAEKVGGALKEQGKARPVQVSVFNAMGGRIAKYDPALGVSLVHCDAEGVELVPAQVAEQIAADPRNREALDRARGRDWDLAWQSWVEGAQAGEEVVSTTYLLTGW